MPHTRRLLLLAFAIGACLFCLWTTESALDRNPVRAADEAAPQILRVGSWNIEHLGNPQARADPNKGVLQEAKDLAKYIRHSRVDLLALQEITADMGAPPGFSSPFRSSQTLTSAFEKLNQANGSEWKHLLFPKRNASDINQWVGIAWNAKKVTPRASR